MRVGDEKHRPARAALSICKAGQETKGPPGVILDDQVEALQALAAAVPEMDSSRVGIFGWSFGGYLSALAVLRRPDVFHAAVAGAPVADWLDCDTFFSERCLGIPPQADAVYARNSLLEMAPRLQRPLLVLHGTSDDNVYFFNSLKLANALFRAGRQQFEFVPLVGFTHGGGPGRAGTPPAAAHRLLQGPPGEAGNTGGRSWRAPLKTPPGRKSEARRPHPFNAPSGVPRHSAGVAPTPRPRP